MRPEWKVTVAGSAAQPSSRPLADAPDETLVAACVAGDRDAFDLIVERHQPARLSVVLSLRRQSRRRQRPGAGRVRSRLSRPEEVQAAASLGTWLYRIGVNVCLNRVGAKTPKPRALEPLASERRADRVAAESAARGAASRRARRAGARGDRHGCRRSSERRSSCACITSCRTSRSPASSAVRSAP